MMQYARILAVSFVPLVVVACEQRSQSVGTLTDQDVAALRQIAERDAPIVRARDWTTLAAEYEEDAVRMPPNAPAVQGREAILKMLQQMPPISAFDFRLVDVRGNSELAYMRGTWSITLAPAGARKPASDSGKILVVFHKQPDGSWLRVADAWNSDVPAPQ
jgi:ketosteroid isomerase-like protein